MKIESVDSSPARCSTDRASQGDSSRLIQTLSEPKGSGALRSHSGAEQTNCAAEGLPANPLNSILTAERCHFNQPTLWREFQVLNVFMACIPFTKVFVGNAQWQMTLMQKVLLWKEGNWLITTLRPCVGVIINLWLPTLHTANGTQLLPSHAFPL